jgi:hypothetical protein
LTRYVVFIALIIAYIVASRRGADEAFLRVWIPVFLFIPSLMFVNIIGLPDPNFAQCAMIPILFFLVKDRLPDMKFGRMEFLIAVYFILRLVMDFLSRGYADAQNYAFYMITALVGPYLVGRYLITSRKMDIATCVVFVVSLVIMFPMFLYELRAWVSPVYKVLGPLFPNVHPGLSLRYGFARTSGTFEHPILACIVVIVAYRLHRWLCWQGFWDQPHEGWLGKIQRWAKYVPFIAFKHQISLILILMAIMTISRGPWIGAFAGAMLTAVGNLKHRYLGLVLLAITALIMVPTAQLALEWYTSAAPGEELTGEAQTVKYRRMMLEVYAEYLEQRFWVGWGLTTVPEVPGMESVDNAYFLMALQHGILAPTLFCLVFLYAIISQIKFGLKEPAGTSPIGFTFAGIYVATFLSFATVYMGAQTEALLFLLLGWGESIKNRGLQTEPLKSTLTSPQAQRRAFRRVLC